MYICFHIFRYSHTTHIIDEKLWMVGGVSLKQSSPLLMVDLKTWKWREYSLEVRFDSVSKGTVLFLQYEFNIVLTAFLMKLF